MNVHDITEWLRTSILGIIILGAVGSLLAVTILKLLVFLLKQLPPAGWLFSFMPGSVRGWFDTSFYRETKKNKDIYGFVAYLIYRSLRCILGAIFSLFCWSITFLNYTEMGTLRLTWGPYVFFVLSLIFTYSSLLDFLSVSAANREFVGPKWIEAKQELRRLERG